MSIDPDRFHVVGVDAELFVLDEDSGASYRIGGSGRRLWELMAGGASIDEAAATVAEETGTDAGTVREDSRRFVAELVEAGILPDDGQRPDNR